MIIFILGWIGTFLVIIGLLYFTSKKASKPKTRLIGLILLNIAQFLLTISAFSQGAYDLATTQIGCMAINFRGMFNCYKEIKGAKIEH